MGENMSSDLSMDKSTDILNISFRRLCISAAQTSRSLCAPADVQAIIEALDAHHIGSQQNTNQGNTCPSAQPQANA